MLEIFRPNLLLNKYQELNLEEFAKKGYSTLLVDLDNTLVPYYEKTITEEVRMFFEKAKTLGIDVIIFSNNNINRVSGFVEGEDIKYYYRALKPTKIGYKRIIDKYNLDKSKTICMGDQLLTDVLGANRMHMYSIYVKPIINKDSWTTKLNRAIEKLLFRWVVK